MSSAVDGYGNGGGVRNHERPMSPPAQESTDQTVAIVSGGVLKTVEGQIEALQLYAKRLKTGVVVAPQDTPYVAIDKFIQEASMRAALNVFERMANNSKALSDNTAERNDLQCTIDDLRTQLHDTNEQVHQLSALIDGLEEQLRKANETIERNSSDWTEERRILKGQIQDKDERIGRRDATIQEKEATITKLTRERDLAQQTANMARERRDEMEARYAATKVVSNEEDENPYGTLGSPGSRRSTGNMPGSPRSAAPPRAVASPSLQRHVSHSKDVNGDSDTGTPPTSPGGTRKRFGFSMKKKNKDNTNV